MLQKLQIIQEQVNRAIIGKEEVVKQVLTVILADGHILLEDIPGVGKTTLALAFSRAMDLELSRVQFTPDVVPSDITGFSMIDRETGEFQYKPGAAMCNILLADEINRTSSKTQSALLEVMQENRITVDGNTYDVPKPFIVIATQNPLGTAGTQMLPEAQLDRFMVQLSIGYPDRKAQVNILKDRRKVNPLETIETVVTREQLLDMKKEVRDVFVDDKIYDYITELCEATRLHELIRLGVSPRGALALCSMAQARAYMDGRTYVTPEDVRQIFLPVCRHRLIPDPKAKLAEKSKDDILSDILAATPLPTIDGKASKESHEE